MALPHAPYHIPFPAENQIPAGPLLCPEAQVYQGNYLTNVAAMPFTVPAPVQQQWGSPRPAELTGLSETMSELAISDYAPPPPSKIRRRNALTIHDPNPPTFHFANEQQLPNQPDSFERSFLLQRMEELQNRLGGANLVEGDPGFGKNFEEISPPPPSPDPYSEDYHDFTGPLKRKVAGRKSSKKEIERISLHADLATYRPQNDFGLPESLLRSYRANKCNALVLYQPPLDLLAQLKQGEGGDEVEEENNNVGGSQPVDAELEEMGE